MYTNNNNDNDNDKVATTNPSTNPLLSDERLLVRDWKAHDAPITTMIFHPNHPSLLATGSADMSVRVWDIDRGYCTHHFRGHQVLLLLAFVPAAATPTIATSANRMDKKRTVTEPHWLLVSASEDGQIKVWDLTQRSCLATLEGHVSAVRALDFSPEGLWLLSAGRDRIVNVWRMSTWTLETTRPVFEALEALHVLRDDHSNSSMMMENQTKETRVMIAGERGQVRVFDLSSWVCLYDGGTENNATKNKKRAKKGDDSSRDSTAGRPPSSFNDGPEATVVPLLALQHLRGIGQISYSRSSQRMLVAYRDHTLSVLTALTLQPLKSILGHLDDVIDLQFVANPMTDPTLSFHLALATNSERIHLLDTDTLACVSLDGHTDMVLALCTSQDGRLLVSGAKDNSARLWRPSFFSDSDNKNISYCIPGILKCPSLGMLRYMSGTYGGSQCSGFLT